MVQVSKPRPVKVLAWLERAGRVLAPAETPAAALVEAGRPLVRANDLRPSARATICGERDHVAVASTPAQRRL